MVCPSSRHCKCDATRSAWLTSCSTSSTVSPVARICGGVGVDALHHDQDQAEGELVEQQHARVGDQRPADGDRLLLAAGQLGRALRPALAHPAEQLVDALDRPRSFPRVGGADLQVLLDRKRAEQAPPLRHHDDPGGGAQGNLTENPNAHIFVMDYAHRRRVKIWGEARVVDDDPALTQSLMPKGYKARPEQVILFKIAAWDTNCAQHIPQKFDAADVAAALAQRDTRIAELEAELAGLKGEPAPSHQSAMGLG